MNDSALTSIITVTVSCIVYTRVKEVLVDVVGFMLIFLSIFLGQNGGYSLISHLSLLGMAMHLNF